MVVQQWQSSRAKKITLAAATYGGELYKTLSLKIQFFLSHLFLFISFNPFFFLLWRTPLKADFFTLKNKISIHATYFTFYILHFLFPPSPPLPFGGWGLATLLSLWGGAWIIIACFAQQQHYFIYNFFRPPFSPIHLFPFFSFFLFLLFSFSIFSLFPYGW